MLTNVMRIESGIMFLRNLTQCSGVLVQCILAKLLCPWDSCTIIAKVATVNVRYWLKIYRESNMSPLGGREIGASVRRHAVLQQSLWTRHMC